MAGADWTASTMDVAGTKLHVARAGRGRPVMVLHHETGTLDRLPFYDALAEQYDVLVPHHPGYSRSERPEWMRSVRDIAVIYRGLLSDLKVANAALVGLGFGGWIAAEMASMAPADLSHLVLVGAMGIKPPQGDILDLAVTGYIDYARAGFHDQKAFDRVYGAEPLGRSARDVGHLPRDELPHRLEALHVQPDPAAPAGRRARAVAGRVGRRRQNRAAQRRQDLCKGAAQRQAGDRQGERPLRRHGAARGARQTGHRLHRRRE